MADKEEKLLTIQLAALLGVLVLAVFVTFFIHKHHLGRYMPPSGAAMLLGILSGEAFVVMGMKNNSFGFSPDAFFYGMLPPIVFSAGLNLRNRDFFRNIGPIFAFAIVGTLISTAIFSFSTYYLFKAGYIKRSSFGRVPLDDCLMYGALVSATDTVATLSVFNDLKAPAQVYNLVFGESVLNDAIAILLFSTVEETYGTEFDASKVLDMVGRFFWISFGSLFVGIGSSLVFALAFRKLQFKNVQGSPAYNGAVYEMSVMLLSAYLAYIIAQSLELSGIVALFFAGIVHNHYSMHNISVEGGAATKDMVEVASFCCETFVFVYLGLQVPHTVHSMHQNKDVDWGLLLTGMPLCLVARALNIFPLAALTNVFRRKPISLQHQTMIWAAGLRGAVAYALALRLRSPVHGTATGNPALEVATLAIVVVSTLGLGAATGPLMHALGVQGDPGPGNGVEQPLLGGSTLTNASLTAPFNGWGAGTSSFTLELLGQRVSAPAIGVHAFWRKFDGLYLKPIFGGRPYERELCIPPPPTTAAARLVDGDLPLAPDMVATRSMPEHLINSLPD